MSASSVPGVDSQDDELKLVVDLVRLSRLTLLYAEADLDKSAVLRSAVLPLFEDDASRARKEIAILVDSWDNEPLAGLIAQLNDVAAASIGDGHRMLACTDRSLAGVLKSWEQEFGVSFVVILDRFEQHLSASDDALARHQFEEQLAAAVNDHTLRTHFLLALNEDAAPALRRLREGIPALDDARVRLSRSGARAYCVDTTPGALELDSAVEHSSSGPTLAPEVPAWAGSAPLEAYMVDAAAPFYGSPSELQQPKRSESLAECLERMRVEYSAPAITAVRKPARRSSMRQDDPPAVPKAEAAYVDKRLRCIVRAKSKTAVAQRRYQSRLGATPPVATDPPESPQSACEDKLTIAHTLVDAIPDTQEVAATSETPREQHGAAGAGDGYRLSPPVVHVVSYERYRFFRRVCLFGALGMSVLALWLMVTPQYEYEPSEARVSTESTMDLPGSAPGSVTTDVTAGRRDSSDVDANRGAIAERDSSATSDPPAQQRSALAPAAAAVQPSDVTTARTRTVVKARTPAPKRSASATPAALHGTSGPMLYIRVRSESQRARAEQMIQPLAKRGIRVTDIKLVDAGPPVADVRYFDPGQRDGAVKIALALRELGVSAQRLQQVAGSETLKGQRRFELWLSSAAP